jgi:hypothetical protein
MKFVNADEVNHMNALVSKPGTGSFYDSPSPWVEHPMATVAVICHLTGMNILLLIVVLLLLFGGGGFYFGGPVIGGSGLGLILLICLIIFLAGGFRGSKN